MKFNIKRISRLITTTIMFISIMSCGTLATPYQAFTLKGVRTGGYLEEKFPANQVESKQPKYRITYVGNGATSMETAVKYWYRRADELCNQKYIVENLKAIVAEGEVKFESYHLVGAALISIPGKAKTSSPNVIGDVLCQ